MPKRKFMDKIERYQEKIRKLEEKELRRRRQFESSDSEKYSDNEQEQEVEVLDDNGHQDVNNINMICDESVLTSEEVQTAQETAPIPELPSDVLAALGEVTEETPKFGPKIHDSLSHLWLPILRKGMDKEAKDKLMKQYPVPENCSLLRAPKLNPEILAAVTDPTRSRDKRVESVQHQLGAGITALNRGLDLLLDSDSDRLQAVKHLSESSRLLCDLHFVETEARRKFVMPGLDKSFLNIIQEVERDDMLFGNKLSDKIKASRAIEKQGLQIKKVTIAPHPQPSTSRPRSIVGNWTGPPRYSAPSNRGRGRGGPRKTAPVGRRAATTPHTKAPAYSKQRAPNQHQ